MWHMARGYDRPVERSLPGGSTPTPPDAMALTARLSSNRDGQRDDASISLDARQWAVAGATVVSAVVVAIQVWHTRAAAEAASKAAETANEALEVARRSGLTAEEALTVSRDIAKESSRARLDASAPALSVTAGQWSSSMEKLEKRQRGPHRASRSRQVTSST